VTNKLFVGGFPYETTQEQLTELFKACGTVKSVKILMDRETGRSRRISFVEMATEAEAQAAINKLNGTNLGARKIFVTEARPPEKRPAGFVRPSGGGGLGGGHETSLADEPPRKSFAERKKKWTEKKKWDRKRSGGKPKDPMADEGGFRNKREFNQDSWD